MILIYFIKYLNDANFFLLQRNVPVENISTGLVDVDFTPLLSNLLHLTLIYIEHVFIFFPCLEIQNYFIFLCNILPFHFFAKKHNASTLYLRGNIFSHPFYSLNIYVWSSKLLHSSHWFAFSI